MTVIPKLILKKLIERNLIPKRNNVFMKPSVALYIYILYIGTVMKLTARGRFPPKIK